MKPVQAESTIEQTARSLEGSRRRSDEIVERLDAKIDGFHKEPGAKIDRLGAKIDDVAKKTKRRRWWIFSPGVLVSNAILFVLAWLSLAGKF